MDSIVYEAAHKKKGFMTFYCFIQINTVNMFYVVQSFLILCFKHFEKPFLFPNLNFLGL